MKPKILLVEDNVQLLEMFAAILESDYEVTQCDHCDMAINLLRNGEAFDAVVSDFDCPTSGGGALIAKELRDLFPGVPFIIMSGNPDVARVTKMCRPDRYMAKPFVDMNIVKEALEDCIKQRAQEVLPV